MKNICNDCMRKIKPNICKCCGKNIDKEKDRIKMIKAIRKMVGVGSTGKTGPGLIAGFVYNIYSLEKYGMKTYNIMKDIENRRTIGFRLGKDIFYGDDDEQSYKTIKYTYDKLISISNK